MYRVIIKFVTSKKYNKEEYSNRFSLVFLSLELTCL